MKKNSAFSLIELSIVILIIGILIAGVTQSSRLVGQFRIKTAQTLTQSSPVNSIKDLAVWYETSMEASIIDAEREDGKTVTTWYDIATQSTYKNNATQATAENRPKFMENVLNGLPVIRFDGVDDSLPFDGTILAGTPYTIFVVEQRRAAGNFGIFIGGSSQVVNTDLLIGYRDIDLKILQAHYSYDLSVATPAFSVATPRMHTFLMSTSIGKNYWSNGGTTADATQPSQTSPLLINPGSEIGRWLTFYFNGDIAEIIIFTRALKTEERQAVETYLSKKWGIKIS